MPLHTWENKLNNSQCRSKSDYFILSCSIL